MGRFVYFAKIMGLGLMYSTEKMDCLISLSDFKAEALDKSFNMPNKLCADCGRSFRTRMALLLSASVNCSLPHTIVN